MKKIALLAAGFLVGSAAFAQSLPPVKYGLKVGVNLPKLHVNNSNGEDFESESATNFSITGYADVPVANGLSVQPGISLQGKGGKQTWGGSNVNGERKDNTMYAEIPVNLVGKIPLGTTGTNFYLGAGPYAAFAISGERKQSGSFFGAEGETKRDLEFGSDNGDDYKGTDFGVNFLAGFQLNSGFNIGAGYGLGLSDLRPNGDGDNGKTTNRVLSFSVGYAF
ncbi:outer membrane protein with beta-barrel domain [Arcticibacter pallidicorallinus]|uniref:Outer membrane protein with beta-barrel domain n=1 Tax=Arcticibacter pallidicorallinus TaxID=1259464 RepID=A0A2T0U3D4_9SPHI|nr:outer membrane beta-barrel protein [Arcticibacter pallidicorallinus]PRY52378.1 outer membrane protein with beta-barrel domain [Arcticibacter pallidicorallinus]